jgi:zona occludens toxin (predicted ATPase)
LFISARNAAIKREQSSLLELPNVSSIARFLRAKVRNIYEKMKQIMIKLQNLMTFDIHVFISIYKSIE